MVLGPPGAMAPFPCGASSSLSTSYPSSAAGTPLGPSRCPVEDNLDVSQRSSFSGVTSFSAAYPCETEQARLSAQAQAGAWRAEMYRELEKLELELVHERQRAAALVEEKVASEAAHARDIAVLEEMLTQVSAEQTRLGHEIVDLKRENAALRRDNEALRKAAVMEIISTSKACRLQGDVFDMSRPATPEEPEIERSVDLDQSDRPLSCSTASSR